MLALEQWRGRSRAALCCAGRCRRLAAACCSARIIAPRLDIQRGQVVHAGQHLGHDAALHLTLRCVALGGDGINLIWGRMRGGQRERQVVAG